MTNDSKSNGSLGFGNDEKSGRGQRGIVSCPEKTCEATLFPVYGLQLLVFVSVAARDESMRLRKHLSWNISLDKLEANISAFTWGLLLNASPWARISYMMDKQLHRRGGLVRC